MKISVVICSHNPKIEYLNKVLDSLKNQTLSQELWELLLIDNNSSKPLQEIFDLSWHSKSRYVFEEKLGLVHARVRGVKEAQYEIIVSVDDDTPLFPDYLEHALRIYETHPELGIIGGRTVPVFEGNPPKWLPEFYSSLAIKDLGDQAIICQLKPDEAPSKYPASAALLIAPKRECMLRYISYYEQNEEVQELGRKGNDLASGEDNDINLFIFKNGYALGYFPELKFYHIIPVNRMSRKYLSQLQFKMNKTWVKVLFLHNILPWKKISSWSVPFRKAKAWVTYGAWKSDRNYIKWRGACGLFEGLADL